MRTFRIDRLAKITGLSKHVLRAWERRYDLIKPQRGLNRYRCYSEEDAELLCFIKSELEKGQSIGDLAILGREELLNRMTAAAQSRQDEPPYERLLTSLLASLDPLDRAAFEHELNETVALLPFEEALHRVLVPLQIQVGELWHDGQIEVATEHFVTKHVQQRLFSAMNQLRNPDGGTKIVEGCAPDELHEIGAQIVAYICASRGCRTHYLGQNVPIASLAALCSQVAPHLTLLSLTIPPSPAEAMTLAQQLSDHVSPFSPIVAGGVGAVANKALLEDHHIEVLNDTHALEQKLLGLFRAP